MGGTHKRLLLLTVAAGILALGSLFLAGLVLASQVGKRPAVGTPAPDFEMALYAGYQASLGETIRLADLRGRVVVINFWASWCLECEKEAPDLEATYRRYQDRGVIFLGVDYLDTETAALAYLRQFEVTYTNGIDVEQKIAQAYRITGVPETFVVDQDGIVRDVVAQRVTAAHLSNVIDGLLAP